MKSSPDNAGTLNFENAELYGALRKIPKRWCYAVRSQNNATSQGSGAQGELDFSPDISNQNLWFVRSGNDLKIDVMGSHDQFTISNWFGSNPAASLADIMAGNGLRLDSSVLQLVQAMATYSANNPGFDPTIVTQAPADSSLQTAIAGAWH